MLNKEQNPVDKLGFGGQWPLTMRAWCSAFRYCPNPLGIVTAKQLDKLEFDGQWPLTMRHRLRRLNKIISRPVASFRSAYGIR